LPSLLLLLLLQFPDSKSLLHVPYENNKDSALLGNSWSVSVALISTSFPSSE
jgi:hypothetical protein